MDNRHFRKMMKRWLVIILALLLVTVAYIGAAEQNVVMEIEGMSCKLCTLAVKKALSGTEGVSDVEVSLEEKKAWLLVDESVTDKILIESVEKAGKYKARVVEKKTKE